MKGKYLYGIIENKDLDQRLKKNGLSTVDYQNLAAVIRETEYKDYRSLAKEEALKELIVHQQRIETIMEEVAYVLPVKFGTILKDEEEVRSVLEKGYSFLLDTLRKIEGKVELDLVCFWNEQKAAQMAYQESKKVRDFYKRITSEAKTPRMVARQRPRLLRGGGVEDEIALGKLVAQYLENKKKKLSSQILKVLKKEAVKSCLHTLADVNMILNRAFLVEKKNEEVFSQALDQLDRRFNGLLNFRLVGPLPPFSFATVVVDALDREEVEKAKELLNLNGSTSLTAGGEINKEEIKKLYNELAFRLHPDKGGKQGEFELATKSYQILKKYADQGLMGVSLYRWEHENPDLHSDYPY